MTDTVLLTGISGFIAKRIAVDLLNAGYAVRGTLRSMGRADEVRDAVRPALTDAADLDTRLTFAEADLTRDDGWDAAMAGVSALIHTASPFPIAQPKDENELIRPAVDGTLRALRAAEAAGVTRVVLTSSMVAIMQSERPSGAAYTEADWTDLSHPTASPYNKSKTMAERAAWDFVKEHPGMQLTAINPGLVLGTPMDGNYGSSLELIERFMSGKDPAVPNFGLPIVDLADVSAMHVRALSTPESVGQRFVAAASYHMAPEMAGWLAEAYPDRKIATRVAPAWLLRILALFDRQAKMVLPELGRIRKISNAQATSILGISFTPAKEALLASAAAIAAKG